MNRAQRVFIFLMAGAVAVVLFMSFWEIHLQRRAGLSPQDSTDYTTLTMRESLNLEFNEQEAKRLAELSEKHSTKTFAPRLIRKNAYVGQYSQDVLLGLVTPLVLIAIAGFILLASGKKNFKNS